LSAPDTDEFSMLGVTWDDPTVGEDVTVDVRTRGTRGGWSEWEQMHIEAAPAPESGTTVRGGTEPLWVGTSRGVQVRVGGQRPTGLRLSMIDPGEGPEIKLQSATVGQPRIITRAQWGADPNLASTCGNGLYGPTTRAVTVHHTVNSNNYSESQAYTIVRGIYAYHTQNLGWCDLGYNFLVDKYGQTFQGRRGDMNRQGWGAHAGNSAVNQYSTGIAMIGNFETAHPTAAMRRAAVDVAAWRLSTHYRNPSGTTSIGNVRYPRIMAHRDVRATACPGLNVYNWLPTMRTQVSNRVGSHNSAIYRRWQDAGGESGWLGSPRIGERPLAGGRVTIFTNGRIYWSEGTRARAIGTQISSAYIDRGGPGGYLGYPRQDEHDGRSSGVRLAVFQKGAIYRHSTTGPVAMGTGIYHHYLRLGADSSAIGIPTRSERGGQISGLRITEFARGAIYRHPRTGAQSVRGPLYTQYVQVGEERSRLGLPVRDPYRVTGGWRSNFENGYIFMNQNRQTSVHYY
jgi:uncharacterized protein with LGFP repeats